MPVAIITGAASGIGLALSRHFSEQGWQVALADVDVATGERAAQELGERAFFHKTDVSNWDDVATLFKETKRKFGRVDYVAANAGVADLQSLYEKQPGEPTKPNLKTIDIDLIGPIYCLWLAAHYFRMNGEQGGSIVITSSSAGLYKFPTNPQYAAAKHGVRTWKPLPRDTGHLPTPKVTD
jgi:NAD(P)-dependent dehydrogenase (short-subunit alcohol dehydrogenase family)